MLQRMRASSATSPGNDPKGYLIEIDYDSRKSKFSDGASLSGTQNAQGSTQPVTNGKVEGNKLSWSANITSPMPLTLEFSGNVEGDKIAGSVKAGAFGSFPFSGAKTA